MILVFIEDPCALALVSQEAKAQFILTKGPATISKPQLLVCEMKGLH